MILILSNLEDDAHVPPVAAELERRGEEYRIFNPATYPVRSTLTVDNESGGVKAKLAWDECELELNEVKSVWLRRPGDVQLSDSLLPEEDKWLRTECNHLVRAMWANLNALWVSEPHHIRRASLKLLQLRLATELGFKVPRFIVTNDVDRAAAFLDSSPRGAVVKVLGAPTIYNQERAAAFYTHLVTEEDREQLDSVRFGPTFLQEFVVKSMDVRVTIIGDRLFAVGIDSTQFEDAHVDFRLAEVFDLPHQCLKLPDIVEDACFELVRRLGLRFGAIDLLLTADGEYIFLEINPNGQWLWIEWITGMPMTKAMCDLLSLQAGD